jgi:hypothetical protein
MFVNCTNETQFYRKIKLIFLSIFQSVFKPLNLIYKCSIIYSCCSIAISINVYDPQKEMWSPSSVAPGTVWQYYQFSAIFRDKGKVVPVLN